MLEPFAAISLRPEYLRCAWFMADEHNPSTLFDGDKVDVFQEGAPALHGMLR